jgi:hypothetical protein
LIQWTAASWSFLNWLKTSEITGFKRKLEIFPVFGMAIKWDL